MRIAIFTETFVPQVNGVVTRLRRTLPYLTGRGDSVLVVAPVGSPDVCDGAEVAGVRSVPLPFYPEVSMALPSPTLGARLGRFRPDLIHAVNPAVLGLTAVYHARARNLPLVASFHTDLPSYLHHYGLGSLEPLVWRALRSIHNQASVNLCISEPSAMKLIEHGFDRVRVGWRGGVDTELFQPGRRDPDMRRRLAAGDSDAGLLLYVGRLGAEKDIESLRPVLEAMPESRLAIVGDGPHRAALERHFSGQRVHFAGYLRGEELAAAYASADAFVFPSRTETLGLVVLEAMACGCPVVAARAGGVPDLVRDGHNGMLFEPGQPAAAAMTLRRLLGAPALREALRVNGRRQAELWGWAAAASDLRSHYEAALMGSLDETAA